MFAGTYETLFVNGKPMKVAPGELTLHRAMSWVQLIVGSGDSITVEVSAAHASGTSSERPNPGHRSAKRNDTNA